MPESFSKHIRPMYNWFFLSLLICSTVAAIWALEEGNWLFGFLAVNWLLLGSYGFSLSYKYKR